VFSIEWVFYRICEFSPVAIMTVPPAPLDRPASVYASYPEHIPYHSICVSYPEHIPYDTIPFVSLLLRFRLGQNTWLESPQKWGGHILSSENREHVLSTESTFYLIDLPLSHTHSRSLIHLLLMASSNGGTCKGSARAAPVCPTKAFRMS
jgi:hypothetical protein